MDVVAHLSALVLLSGTFNVTTLDAKGVVQAGCRTESTKCSPHVAACEPCARTCNSVYIVNGYRFEPKLRDIRHTTSWSSLPGGGVGQRDVVPVLPPRSKGYFVLPAR